MSTTMSKVLKAVAGAAVLLVLVAIVNNWWGDYRELSDAATSPDTETTATAEPTEPAASEDEGGEQAAPEQPTKESKTVVILTDGLNFREEPSSKANVIRGLDEGEKLVLIEEKSGWYHVQDQDGTKGWISSKSSYSRVE